jgi:hypothetical protein
MEFKRTGKLLRAVGAGIFAQRPDLPDDTNPIFHVADGFELLACTGLDENLIACHAVGVP